MRFRGGGVGHKSTRRATDFFKTDRDPLDEQVSESDSDDNDSGSERAIEEEDEELIGDDSEEELAYGYVRDSESESGSESDLPDSDDHADGIDEELEDQFGPEDDGGAIDPDMDAFGYADL